MSDIIQIFNGSDTELEKEVKDNNAISAEFTMESVRSMVKQMNEIDDQVKVLREDKKELFSDFVEQYNVPKKEVLIAIRMLKSDIDPEVTVDVYSNIADLVE
jgi:hypothetical protein